MVFDVPALIAYISAYIALDPGDLVITGTPSGVGVFRDPPVFLEPGDVVRCEIEGIGRVENRVMDGAPRGS
jgi:2-keto-4-pentenoate hydratase/2-oxohepta-3-ene-1,7-dioic acid hydratase in catechol pathway